MEPNITSQNEPLPVPPLRTPGVFQGSPDMSARTTVASSIRTMKNDMSEAIKKQNETYVSIALAEERKRKEEQAVAPAMEGEKLRTETVFPRRRGRAIIIVGILSIIVAGGLTLRFLVPVLRGIEIPSLSLPNFGGDTELATTTLPIPYAPPIILAPSLIPARSEKQFNISQETPDLILAKIAVEYASGMEVGSIKNLYFYEKVAGEAGERVAAAVSTDRVLALTGMRTPELLARALERDGMVGIFGEETGSAPFLILKVSNYDGGLAGMLAWEKDLPRFFDRMFGAKFEADSTDVRAVFRDIIIRDRDARVQETIFGQSIAYAFADASTIVIAGSKSALGELLLKIGATGR